MFGNVWWISVQRNPGLELHCTILREKELQLYTSTGTVVEDFQANKIGTEHMDTDQSWLIYEHLFRGDRCLWFINMTYTTQIIILWTVKASNHDPNCLIFFQAWQGLNPSLHQAWWAPQPFPPAPWWTPSAAGMCGRATRPRRRTSDSSLAPHPRNIQKPHDLMKFSRVVNLG